MGLFVIYPEPILIFLVIIGLSIRGFSIADNFWNVSTANNEVLLYYNSLLLFNLNVQDINIIR